jgi:hypothetical protein
MMLQYDALPDKYIAGPLLYRATNCLLNRYLEIRGTAAYKEMALALAEKLFDHTNGMGYDKRTEFAPEMETYYRRALVLARQSLDASDKNLKRFIEAVLNTETFINNEVEIARLKDELAKIV